MQFIAGLHINLNSNDIGKNDSRKCNHALLDEKQPIINGRKLILHRYYMGTPMKIWLFSTICITTCLTYTSFKLAQGGKCVACKLQRQRTMLLEYLRSYFV